MSDKIQLFWYRSSCFNRCTFYSDNLSILVLLSPFVLQYDVKFWFVLFMHLTNLTVMPCWYFPILLINRPPFVLFPASFQCYNFSNDHCIKKGDAQCLFRLYTRIHKRQPTTFNQHASKENISQVGWINHQTVKSKKSWLLFNPALILCKNH